MREVGRLTHRRDLTDLLREDETAANAHRAGDGDYDANVLVFYHRRPVYNGVVIESRSVRREGGEDSRETWRMAATSSWGRLSRRALQAAVASFPALVLDWPGQIPPGTFRSRPVLRSLGSAELSQLRVQDCLSRNIC